MTELNVQTHHTHVIVSIQPKVWISVYMETIKGEIAIKLFKNYPGIEEEALLGESLLGARIFCEYGWFGQRDGKGYGKYQEEDERKEERDT